MGCLTLAYQLLFLQLLLLYSQTSATLCSYDQSIALLQFKQHFSYKNFLSYYYCDWARERSFQFSEIPPYCDGRCPSYRKTMSWKEDTDCCSWDGVTCDILTGHVIALDLSCGWLHGNIPSNSSLFLLHHLQRLNLAFNDFKLSQVSSDFRQLPSLTHLNLSNSNFSGKIPTEISHLSNLVSLDLSVSDFFFEAFYSGVNSLMRLETAVFQELVQNLTKLTELRLDGVDMSTIVPSFLTNLSYSLTSLSLNDCGLQGNIPDHIFRSPNLQFLRLRGNFDLKGVFPKVNWSSPLKFMDVSDMSLSGELPNSIGDLMSLYHLRLYYCNMVGSIPMSLGNLTQLTYLSLSSNNFSGHIPSFLSNLVQLRHFDLSMNNFVGEFPDIFVNFTQLSHLELSGNQLSGQIPSHAGGLRNLVVISLSSNSLNGTIPSWLFAHPFLKEMDLKGNQLIGHIDQFQSNSLQWISIDDNRLHGSIPSSIFELDLIILSLSSNNLSGIVELHMFSKLKNLTWLDLSHNSLSVSTKFIANSSFPQLLFLDLSSCNISEFPGILRSLDHLVGLDLSENKIHGQIPNWMWNTSQDSLSSLNLSHNYLTSMEQLPWKNLRYLDLHSNLLQGPIPIPPPYLGFFSLSKNELTGEIPHLICNMSYVEILDLSNNRLSGIIPECMGNFSSLHVLDLRKNSFYGSIPGTFAKGNVYRTLNLTDNGLEGPVPRSLLNCSNLEVLDLGNNKINDTFPYWLGNLPELRVLVLRSNKFYGSIRDCSNTNKCFPKLRIFDLSNNSFNNFLPTMYFKNLEAMMDVGEDERELKYMGEDYYQDSVILTWKGHEIQLERIITTCTTIDFSNNYFHGEIPGVIGNLLALHLLNLSHNNLSGCIPSSFGNLTDLESLDLSSNKLTGKIPWQLANLNFLGWLNLSQNRLSGPVPRVNHFDTFSNNSYDGNLALCGFPLSQKCGTDDGKQQTPSTLEDDAESSSGFGWKVVLMGYGCGMVLGVTMGYLVFSTGKPQWVVRIVEGGHPRKGRRLTNKRGGR